MNRGYLKLWRRAEDSAAFKDPHLWQLWSWCLIQAAWKPKEVTLRTGRGTKVVHLEPGQFIFGRKSAAKELGYPESSMRNRMAKLEKLENVDIKVDTHWSIVSIINWETYQADEEKEDRQQDRQRTGKGQAKDTTKEVKEVEAVKKEPKPSRSTALAISLPPEAMQASNLLADLVLENLPNTAAMLNGKRDKTVSAWALDIDKLNRIDGWSWPQINFIVRWCQADDFWKGNIRSGAKLREKFEKLVLKAKSQNTKAIPDWEKKYHERKARMAQT